MTEVIEARFKPGGKEYTFNPNGLTIRPGQGVILSTTRGEEYGECTRGNHMVDETDLTAPLRPVVRLATEADLRRREEQKAREREAMQICQEKIEEHGLEMSLVSCEYSLDGSKVLFYFTAENRVDFRALVKDLAGTFRTRIELRQIGVRDETKLLGGLGICGQPYCCSRFLDRFQPVSIKMAKTQSLSLNPTKISGACGRLMCCLKYEQEAYEDAMRRCPKKESFVETPDGVGTVTDVNYIREKVKVRLEDAGSDAAPKQYLNQEIRIVRNGKGKRPEDYVAPPKAELEALRYIPPKEERQTSNEPKGALTQALEDLFANEEKRTPVRKPGRSGGPRPRRTQGGQPHGGGQNHSNGQNHGNGQGHGNSQNHGNGQNAQGGRPRNRGGHPPRRRPQGPKGEG